MRTLAAILLAVAVSSVYAQADVKKTTQEVMKKKGEPKAKSTIQKKKNASMKLGESRKDK